VNAAYKHVAVIGAGVAGLTAAEALARWGVKVSLFEKTPFLGGHAVQLNCKAADACVKCGACLAEEKLRQVVGHDKVDIYTGTRIEAVSDRVPYQIRYQVQSPLVNADRCNGCGICLPKCPVPGAILQGRAPRVGPYVAIRRDLCRYFDNGACSLCRDTCPQDAIHLADTTQSGVIEADAVVLATGFEPYNPSSKPYGYGRFPNVITSLDAERLLREDGRIRRPSDGKPAKRLAFIQCVGSRDASLGHSWCSKICCGSSMRMGRLLQSRQTDVAVSFFYIDVQTYGKDFPIAYAQARDHLNMVRAIPGEVRATAADELEVITFDPQTGESREDRFDVVVLSVGLLPSADNRRLAQTFDLTLDDSGWLSDSAGGQPDETAGVFTAGTVSGPMTIAQSISSAEQTVYALLHYLGVIESRQGAA
jgi:heterodisulfide reductase subunit A